VVEHLLHTQGVAGSNPAPRTIRSKGWMMLDDSGLQGLTKEKDRGAISGLGIPRKSFKKPMI
jgi:hypothetical protein